MIPGAAFFVKGPGRSTAAVLPGSGNTEPRIAVVYGNR